MQTRYIKDPDAVLDYALDWAEWLGADTIQGVTWIVSTGLTLTAKSHTATTATVWLAGGTVGATYAVTCRVTTALARTDDRTITLVCAER